MTKKWLRKASGFLVRELGRWLYYSLTQWSRDGQILWVKVSLALNMGDLRCLWVCRGNGQCGMRAQGREQGLRQRCARQRLMEGNWSLKGGRGLSRILWREEAQALLGRAWERPCQKRSVCMNSNICETFRDLARVPCFPMPCLSKHRRTGILHTLTHLLIKPIGILALVLTYGFPPPS